MTDIKKDTFPKARGNPIFANLPVHLKDPKNFKKIQKLLVKELRVCKKSHSEISEYAMCVTCQRAFRNKGMAMKKLGFASAAQYMAWVKVHTKIEDINKVRLPKYNKP